jgi:uncharacterized membrane protein YedE/YeeE
VAGPLIGLIVPGLLLVGGKQFGISSNLRHLCAAVLPTRMEYFKYDWKKTGLWNLTFAFGIILGAFLASTFLTDADAVVAISDATQNDLRALGITDFTGLAPMEIFSWQGLQTIPGFVFIVVGGFFVGFGARYGGGCTSGHAISGLSNLQWPSLLAVIGFFVGGLIATHFILPIVL